jgi:hypothetical protein
MAKEPNGELGVAYRALEQEVENLRILWEKGEVRLSSEQIQYKLEALIQIHSFEGLITQVLMKFKDIAPPARKEPAE